MIELSNIIMFLVLTGVLVAAEGFVYRSINCALKVIPVAMIFSGILVFVWNILP